MDELRLDMSALADAIERDSGKCCNAHCERKVEWPGRSFCAPCRFALEDELAEQEAQEARDEEEKARNCFGLHVTWPSWREG